MGVYICSGVMGGGLNRRTDLTDRQKRQSAVGVGVAIGVGLGLALNNILLGVAFGVLIGAGLAATPKSSPRASPVSGTPRTRVEPPASQQEARHLAVR